MRIRSRGRSVLPLVLAALVAACGGQGSSPTEPEVPPDPPRPDPPGAVERRFVDDREVRREDGKWNNLASDGMGGAPSHLGRYSRADYGDGVSAMTGAGRPGAREVSNLLHAEGAEPKINSFGTSDFLWVWGQFLDHDLSLTPAGRRDDPEAEQAPIPVPVGDPWFDPMGEGGRSIPFVRVPQAEGTGLTPVNVRELENEITAWIDASHVYGSDEARMTALRVGPGSPLLRMDAEGLLPINEDGLAMDAEAGVDPEELFLAGDVRANEQLGLAAMHILFVREHNRIAQAAFDADPTGDAEAAFYYARRMVGAIMQKITYEDFLPALIGEDALPDYQGYRSWIDASVSHEFSTAAFRFGHSSVNPTLVRLDADGSEAEGGPVSLRASYFVAPYAFGERGDIDPLLRGFAATPHRRIDLEITDDLRNFLFGPPGAGGFDLAALNVQRGRDHGVPSYNDVRELMGLPRALSFEDVTSDPDVAAALATAYASVHDVDLWVGGLAEDPLAEEGSQVGELFRAILVRQFAALRDGDRFWYEADLRHDELAEIRATTLADVIKRNTGIGEEMSDDAFRVPQATATEDAGAQR